MTATEQAYSWGTPEGNLAGVLHWPAADSARAAVVIVHPFAEEKKFAHRVLVNLARALAQRNIAVLRFDLSGCGDSFGNSRERTLEDWLYDIDSACNQLDTFHQPAPIVLVGLRLGATLALAAHAANPWGKTLVLWEPVLSGRKYIDEILRRRMIKEMMTTGRKATGRADVLRQLEADGFLDLDGLAVGRKLIEDISALDATALAEGFRGRALCVQIAFNAKVSSALERFSATLAEGGAEVETIGIREQVIWDRVELVEAAELIATTADWIAAS